MRPSQNADGAVKRDLVKLFTADDITVCTQESDGSLSEQGVEVISIISNDEVSTTTKDDYLACGMGQFGSSGSSAILEIVCMMKTKRACAIDDKSQRETKISQPEALKDEHVEFAKQRVIESAKRLLGQRGTSIRKELRDLLQQESATLLQARVRGMLIRNQMKKMASEAEKMVSAANCIKTSVRYFLSERRTSASTIQKHVRGTIARYQFLTIVGSAIVIQAHARGMITRSANVNMENDQASMDYDIGDGNDDFVGSVTKIQALVRGMITRTSVFNNEYGETLLDCDDSSFVESESEDEDEKSIEEIPKFPSVFRDTEFWRDVGDEMVDTLLDGADMLLGNADGWFNPRKTYTKETTKSISKDEEVALATQRFEC
jgi:hypothetical protein